MNKHSSCRGLVALGFCLCTVSAAAQETVRHVRGDGWTQKFLTRDLTDSWKFEGRAGLVVEAKVNSSEFDPTIQLVRVEGDAVEVLEERDDEGNASGITRRLTRPGKYEIRVFAFERRGGGNYALKMQRFHTRNLALEQLAKGRLDARGAGAFWFEADGGEVLTWHHEGAVRGLDFYRFSGRALEPQRSTWHHVVTLTKGGFYCVRLRGAADKTFSLVLRHAARDRLALGKVRELQLGPHALQIFDFETRERCFHRLHLHHKQNVHLRLLLPADTEFGVERNGSTRAVRWLPMKSKGDDTRWAFVTRAPGRYQLQVLSDHAAAASLEAAISRGERPIQPTAAVEQALAVGDAHFHAFTGQPGQRVEIRLSSTTFDPVLRLTDAGGNPLLADDNSGPGLSSHIDLLIPKSGRYRLQVASAGDGGGGPYRLQLRDLPIPSIAVGESVDARLTKGRQDYWHLEGRAGQEILVQTSGSLDTRLAVHGPDGKRLAQDDNSGIGRASLVALRLPRDGTYTIGVGATTDGSCRLRVLR